MQGSNRTNRRKHSVTDPGNRILGVPDDLTAEGILALAESFRAHLVQMYSLRLPKRLPSLSKRRQEGFKRHWRDSAHHLRRAAVLRAIDGDPLLDFEIEWGKLWRDHPKFREGLAKFRQYFPDSDLVAIGKVLERLKIVAEAEISHATEAATSGGRSNVPEFLTPGEQAKIMGLSETLTPARRLQMVAEARNWAKRLGLKLREAKVGRATHVHPEDWRQIVYLYSGRDVAGKAIARNRGNRRPKSVHDQGAAPAPQGSVIKGYECRGCGYSVAERRPPRNCPRCRSASFEPLFR
jgi:rubrerythrin